MKKILIATTALTLLAGAASAEVALSGNARMGILYNGEDTNFTGRIRVIFTMSGETDGGLSFGSSIRADQASNGNAGAASGSVFMSGAFGTISMGDVAGAAEAAVGDLSSVGLTGLGDLSDTVYITGDGLEADVQNPILQYAYSTGGLSLYLSANDGTIGGGSLTTAGGPDVKNYAVGASYAFGDYTAGIGYEKSDGNGIANNDSYLPLGDNDQIIIGGSAKFGAATVKALYGSFGGDADAQQYGLSVDGTFGAATVTGFAKVVEDQAPAGVKLTAIGLGGSYDLGGGAAVKGGVVNIDTDEVGVDSETIADLGVSFSF